MAFEDAAVLCEELARGSMGFAAGVCMQGSTATYTLYKWGGKALRERYFLPALRGLGAGTALMAWCLEAARALGFRRCYLETLCGMDAAQRLYERSGFARIDAAMGATGHFGCNRFYLRAL